MIQNAVFDFGQVMVRFEPKYMVEQYVSDPCDSALLQEVVFDRLYWDRLDEGTITDEEVLRLCRERLPERLWDISREVYYSWIYHIPEIDGMRELVNWLRREYDVRILLLSNISRYFASHASEIPTLSLFDDCIFSAVCGRIKPKREMFAYLCEHCGILAEETLFIDDNEGNIKGAEDFGIKGYVFDGEASRLRSY